MYKYRYLLLICAITFICSALSVNVSAVEEFDDNDFLASYIQTYYNDETGLPACEVNDAFQSSEGYLWFSTYGGLLKYDGRTFMTLNASTMENFPGSSIMSVCEDNYNNILIATNDSGIVIMEKDGNIVTLGRDEGMPSNSVRKIVCGKNDEIIAATTNGICRLDHDRKITTINGTEGYFFTGVVCNTYGDIYAVSNNGFFFEVKADGTVLKHDMGLDSSCIYMKSDTDFYIGTLENSYFVIDFSSGSFELKALHSTDELTDINKIYRDKDGKTWICASNGIGYINSDGSVTVINDLLLDKNISSIIQDIEGNYWITSSKLGVLKLVKSLFLDYSAANELPEAITNACAEFEGVFYMATDTGLLASTGGKQIENYITEYFEGIRIRDIKVDSQGTFWVATYDEWKTVVNFNKDMNVHRRYYVKDGLVTGKARNITELSDGSILIGTPEGISIIKDDTVIKNYNSDNGLVNTVVLSACEDKNGDIYVGTDGGGIFVIRDGKIINQLDESDGLCAGVILRLVRDTFNDCIWASTGNSLALIKNGEVVTINISKTFNNVFDIIPRENGDIWILTSNVIYISTYDELTKDNEVSKIYTIKKSMGLASALTSNSWNWLDENSNLYLCCTEGVNVINMNVCYKTGNTPKIVVSEIVADNETFINTDSVIIPNTTNRLTLKFSVLSYLPMDGTTVEYYLEGLDASRTLSDTTELTEISYTNLKGGSYTFHLRKLYQDGTQSGDEIRIYIEKQYGFFEQLPVQIVLFSICIGIVIIIIFAAIHYKTRAAVKRQNEYKSIVNQAITAITNAIDAKDTYTRGHSVRVAAFSAELAKRFGLSEAKVENMYYIALLHDVGKIGIPDSILNKPDKLTAEEFAIMKRHSAVGAEILKGITAIDNVYLGVKQHHERYDGKGYNDGLKGTEICLEARIICVADSFDAMATKRAYRNHLSKDEILGELRRCRGTQFDPDIDDIMIDMVLSGVVDDIFQEYQAVYHSAEEFDCILSDAPKS